MPILRQRKIQRCIQYHLQGLPRTYVSRSKYKAQHNMRCLPNRMGPTQRRFINLHQSELENRGRLQRQQRLLEQYRTRPKCLGLRRLPRWWRLCWADFMVPHRTRTGILEDCHNKERNGQFGTSLCPMPVPPSLPGLPEQFVCYTFGVSQCVPTLSIVFTGLFAHDKINMCTLRQ